MSAEIENIDIKILDKIISIKCPKDKVDELQKSARYLNEKMLEIQGGNKFIAQDKAAIVAALNIANEFLASRKDEKILSDIGNKLTTLKNKINFALNPK